MAGVAAVAGAIVGHAAPAPLETEPEQATAARGEAPARPRLPPAAGPDTTIWIDDGGVPRPVVGLSYAELLRGWRAVERLEASVEAPRVLRERIRLEGSVDERRARLTARIVVALPAGGRAEAPLGLAGAVLVGEPTISGGADQFVFYDEDRGGFVAWLAGESGDRRTIVLPIIAPLETDRDQATLRLNLPRATRTELRLDSPKPLSEPFATGGAVLESLPLAGGGTRLVVRGAVGEADVGWSVPQPATTARAAAVLSAIGEVDYRVDGRRVESRATLTVDSYDGAFERFRVRLPAGGTLIPDAEDAGPSAPVVRLLPADQRNGGPVGDTSGPVCLVTLPERTTGPATVTLRVEQPLGPDPAAGIDLGGFDVIGAARQHGEIALSVEEDWRLRLSEMRAAARINPASLPAALQRPGVAAAAEYFAQPFSLRVSARRLEARVEAAPRYRLRLAPDTAELTMATDYRLPGARVSAFKIELADWADAAVTLASPGSADLIDTAGVSASDGVLTVPLLRPAPQQVRIELTSRRPLPAGDSPLELRLPTPRASRGGPSELIVVVDEALVVTPDTRRCRRLVAAPVGELDRDAADPTGLRTFRFTGAGPGPVFAADRRLRPGEVTASITTDVALAAERAEVRQLFEFRLRYEPAASLRVSAPAELVDAGAIAFRLLPPEGAVGGSGAEEGVDLPYKPEAPAEEDPGGDGGEKRTALVVTLPRPWIGPCRVQATCVAPVGLIDLESGAVARLPLLTTLGVPVRKHTARATAADGRPLMLGEADAGWTPVAGPEGSAAALVASADQATALLPIATRPAGPQPTGPTVLRHAWWHTWITPQATQQRAVFVFDTQVDAVALRLPATLSQAPVELVVDGQLIEGRREADGTLVAPLREGGPRHVLEARCVARTQAGPASVAWRPIRLSAVDTAATCSWLVTPPAGRLTLGTPSGFAPAPGTGAASLPAEVRPPAAAAMLSGACFTKLGPPPPDEPAAMLVVRRSVVAAGASAFALLCGLVLVYRTPLRRPPALLGMAIAAVAVGWWRPIEFSLVARAALAGVGAATAAGLLAAVAPRFPAKRPDLPAAEGAATPPLPGSDTRVSLPLSGASTNAPTASLAPVESQA